MKNTYTTFIFDFDFTLADASPAIVRCVNDALNKVGIESKDSKDIKKTIGMSLIEAFYILTGNQDEQTAKQFYSYFVVIADEIMTDNTTLYDDTIKILSYLKSKNYKTAIVTSKLHYRIDDVLNKYNIPELIDYIVGFEDVEKPKPDPEGLLKAIDYLKADKKSVLYIGDSLIDANTAANASVDFAAVLTGTTTAQELEKLPHVCIGRNLTEMFERIGGRLIHRCG